jgi:flagellar P-ring protein precursor FlgI
MRLAIVPIFLAVLGLASSTARAVKVADITRLDGQRSNILTGLGLVYGLRGTGDGGDFLPAIRPLAAMLSSFADPTTIRELADVKNVALVSITVTVPPDGVRDGDRLDAYVTSLGAASSLRGGRLFVTPLQGPLPGSGIFAMVEGSITIEDPSTQTVGRVLKGCIMEADLPAQYITDDGRFTLILDDPSASWTTASAIAKVINEAMSDDGEELAIAADPKNVVVRIPSAERPRPDSFISNVQQLPVQLLPTEARVQINERTGTMIITGDVEISPVVISHEGLTISTIQPEPVPTLRRPLVTERNMVSLDTTQQGGAKLQELVTALEQLRVDAEDRITIVKELHRIGKLHGKLIIE